MEDSTSGTSTEGAWQWRWTWQGNSEQRPTDELTSVRGPKGSEWADHGLPGGREGSIERNNHCKGPEKEAVRRV